MRRRLVAAVLVFAGLFAALAIAELIARMIEPVTVDEGNTFPLPDPVVGWIPRPGIVHVRTAEFSVEYNVNDLNMNDRPITGADAALGRRILALGDSHTFGVGVSRDAAWPLVLDTLLFGRQPRDGRVFNGGVAAYNIGQYLQRYRMLRSTLKPTAVLVAVSTATDLFDLLPPRLGGFVYGGDAAREYFDLDDSGHLVERRFEPQNATVATAQPAPRKSSGLQLRTWLRGFALYRRLQNSMMAMRIATTIRLPGGDPIWEGPEAVLHRDLNDREKFQWALARAMLDELAKEVRADGATMTIVLIPYLPEVYDDVWNATFGRSREYDRFAGSRRLHEIADGAGVGFIDTTPALVDAARRSHGWLHYRIDKHPTADGHRVIAQSIAAQLPRALATSRAARQSPVAQTP